MDFIIQKPIKTYKLYYSSAEIDRKKITYLFIIVQIFFIP